MPIYTMKISWMKLLPLILRWILVLLFTITLLLEPIQAPNLSEKLDGTASSDGYSSQKDTGELNTDSHQNAADQNSKDLCPHIELDPKSYQMAYKLRDLNLNGKKRLCCVCPPGTFVAELCFPGEYNTTKCEPCPKGTYVEEYAHIRTECVIESLTCPDHENYIYSPSNITIGPRCYCNPEKPLYMAENGTCVPHSSCSPGQGVLDLGNPYHDTVCEPCPSGFESPTASATEQCQPTKSVKRHRQNQQLFPTTGINLNVTSGHPTSHRGTQPCPTPPSRHPEGMENINSGSIGDVAAAFIGAVVGAIFTLIITVTCYISCCNDKVSNRNAVGEDMVTSSMELTDQKNPSTPPTPSTYQQNPSPQGPRDSNAPRNKEKDQRKRNSEEEQKLLSNNSSASLVTETMIGGHSETVEAKQKAVPILDRSSRGDSIHSTGSPNPGNSGHQRPPTGGAHPLGGEAVPGPSGLSNRAATNTTSNEPNAETLCRQLIEYCVGFLEQQARHCSLQLEFDDVARFCHIRNVALPTEAERSGTPAQGMANAIRRDYDVNHTSYLELLDQLRSQHLNTLADLLKL